MICTNCGQKLTDKATFCMKCGKATSPEVSNKDSQPSNLDQKWWLRLARVLYIGLYIPLFVLIAVLVVLSLNEIRESLKEKRQQKELKARFEKARPMANGLRANGARKQEMPNITYEDAMEALRRADKAGNVKDATRLAEIAVSLRAEKMTKRTWEDVYDALRIQHREGNTENVRKLSAFIMENAPKKQEDIQTMGVFVLRIFLIVFAWMAVLRLMKIVFLYIALAQKPEWKKEFKKLF